MAWTAISKPAVGDPTKKQAFADAVIDDLLYLKAAVDSLGQRELIKNGSFEADSDSDGIPDNWTRTTYTGGTFAIETSNIAHGSKAIHFTRAAGAGNGGGYIESDYFEVTEQRQLIVRWQHYCTAAGMKDRVQVYWFTAAKAACGTASTTIYDSTSNPTSWALGFEVVTPVTTARFAKIRLTGGFTDTDVAGTSYWDDVAIGEPHPDYRDQIEFTTAGTFTWVASRTTVARVSCVGGGGGGMNGGTTRGGGGGGEFSESYVSVTAGSSYAVVVGAAGSGTGPTAGGNSTFATTTVIATGGGAGAIGSGGTGGTGGTGQRKVAGEAGSTGASARGGNSNRGCGGAASQDGFRGGGGGPNGGGTGNAGGSGYVTIEF